MNFRVWSKPANTHKIVFHMCINENYSRSFSLNFLIHIMLTAKIEIYGNTYVSWNRQKMILKGMSWLQKYYLQILILNPSFFCKHTNPRRRKFVNEVDLVQCSILSLSANLYSRISSLRIMHLNFKMHSPLRLLNILTKKCQEIN